MSKLIINIDTQDQRCNVNVEGGLTVQHATTFAEKLKEALASFLPVHLDLTNITSIDVTGIQLSIALKKALQRQGKDVSLSMPANKDVLNLLENTGIIKLYQYV